MKRRRFITIMAGTAAAAALASCRRETGAHSNWEWRGVLFNADVNLALQGMSDGEAERLTAECVGEMQRLERIFSLYLPESTLCTLNREGVVTGAPREFVELIEMALEVSEKSKGVFDPTVQPYWIWLRDALAAGQGWEEAEQRRHLELVDYREVTVGADEVRFAKPGMALTLNGVAQGWITDRVCELLRNRGAGHCLVSLGEYVAIGSQSSGADWRVGIRGMADEAALSLSDHALAVSSGSGHYFGAGSAMNHLIDPRSGRCSDDQRTVAVTAPAAAVADALSTAASVLDDAEAEALVNQWEGAAFHSFRPGEA